MTTPSYRKVAYIDKNGSPAIMILGDGDVALGLNDYTTDFTGCDFRNADFSGACMCDVNFSGADFSEADFRFAEMGGANFTDANLTNTELWAADFGYGNFTRANLTNAQCKETDFTNANLTNADFTNVNNLDTRRFKGADFTGTKLDVKYANLASSTGPVGSGGLL
jgi:uncharacterized protein YjbI with pentapeptide repeats